jgi:hypothetical protein
VTAGPVKEVWALCRVPRERLFYLRYTLEAYEGLCLATTLPGRGGYVVTRTSPELRDELGRTLQALAEEMPLEVLRWGEGEPPAEP